MSTTSRRERSNPEWQSLITQYQILKRKLQSKSEALMIISKDLDTARCERDQFKLMGEKLQEKCQAFKKQQADYPVSSDKLKLIRLLKESKSSKLMFQKQAETLQQKLNEANGDIKLLREKFARQTVGDEGIGARHFPLHEREKLVEELEQSQQECKKWKEEYESQLEVCSEVISDCKDLKVKSERLNEQLLMVLNGDKKRIVDVDALCMENKYLQDRITQCQEEKNTLHSQLAKYKEILTSRKNTKLDLFNPSQLKNAGLVITPKQLKQLLCNQGGQNWQRQLSDLQSVVSALLETINDKNLALHHLRNTNKILGNRVSDLERKLKNLEIPRTTNEKGNIEDKTKPDKIQPQDVSNEQITSESHFSEQEILPNIEDKPKSFDSPTPPSDKDDDTSLTPPSDKDDDTSSTPPSDKDDDTSLTPPSDKDDDTSSTPPSDKDDDTSLTPPSDKDDDTSSTPPSDNDTSPMPPSGLNNGDSTLPPSDEYDDTSLTSSSDEDKVTSPMPPSGLNNGDSTLPSSDEHSDDPPTPPSGQYIEDEVSFNNEE